MEKKAAMNRVVLPVRLSLLNLDINIGNNGAGSSVATRDNTTINRENLLLEPTVLPMATTSYADIHSVLAQSHQNTTRQAAEFMRQCKGEMSLRVHAHDDNNRINERDPSVSLNYALLKQWCMMNALDMYDIDEVMG